MKGFAQLIGFIILILPRIAWGWLRCQFGWHDYRFVQTCDFWHCSRCSACQGDEWTD